MAQEEGEQFQHPGPHYLYTGGFFGGALSDAEAARVIMSSGLEGHRFPTFLSSPDSPQGGSWALESSVGETMGDLRSAIHLLCDNWRSVVPLTGLSSLFVKQRFG